MIRKYMAVAISCLLVGPSFTQGEGVEPKGAIFYRGAPGESDDLVRVREFSSVEVFGYVTNFVSVDGEKNRVVHENLVGVIEYPKLSSATIATPQQIEGFNGIVEKMKGAINRYRAANQVISDDLIRFTAAQQMIQQGNVLIGGQWKSKSQQDMAASSGPVFVPELIVGDQTLTNARLSSIKGGEASIIHSGGVAKAVIADLSDEEIAKLNRTSEEFQIVKSTSLEELDEAAKAVLAKKILEDFEAGLIIDLGGNRYTGVKVTTVGDDAILVSHSRGSASVRT